MGIFQAASYSEQIHHALYTRAKTALANGADVALNAIYVCPNCGFTMEGKRLEECPMCGWSGAELREF